MKEQSAPLRISLSLVAWLGVQSAVAQVDVSIPLTGSDADGYLAVVGFNQEGNQALAEISRDPGDGKFFDYPAYVNPTSVANIFIMYVEPYRFGLDYPDELHPTGLGVFASVGELRPASEAADSGVTFIEGVTEDADFALFDLGGLRFDASLVTGAGTEVVSPADVTFDFDGTEFQSTNRTELVTGADFPPFGPDGRSNRNEAANVVTLSAGNATGTGLIFQGGLLTAIDLVADASVSVTRPDLVGSAFAFDATGPVDFKGSSIDFNIDGQDSVPGINNVRLLLTRTGTIDAVGQFVVPGACAADFNGDAVATSTDIVAVINAVEADEADYDGDGEEDVFDLIRFLRIFDEGCGD